MKKGITGFFLALGYWSVFNVFGGRRAGDGKKTRSSSDPIFPFPVLVAGMGVEQKWGL